MKLKKVVVVATLVCLLIAAFAISCSAFAIPVSEDAGFYLYTPVGVHLTSYEQYGEWGEVETKDWYFSQTEYDNVNRTYTAFYDPDADARGIALTQSNVYRAYNSGYAGYYSLGYELRNPIDITHKGYISINSINLPSVWSIRTLKTGSNSPYVSFEQTYLASTGFDCTYSFGYVPWGQSERVNTSFTIHYNSSDNVPILPDKVKEILGSAIGNWQLFDYQIQFSTGTDVNGNNIPLYTDFNSKAEAFKIVLPDNGGAGRLIPYNDEYSSSYVQSILNSTIDASFDFTSWLSNAFGFFNVPLFGNFTIGGLLSTVVGLGLFIAFLKIFAGG